MDKPKSTSASGSKVAFPKKFLWGASTSSHQVEGGAYNQWTVWELENAKSLAARAEYQLDDLAVWPEIAPVAKSPDNYVSDMGADHYNRYEADFDLLSSLNMNAFRFSIEWSRVEPEEGVWNIEAIEHYKQYVLALEKRGIEPVITLFHFSLPNWFVAMGGFEKRRNIKYFVRYAQKIISELGKNVRLIITINEPEVYVHQSYIEGHWPPGKRSKVMALQVLRNLATAHNHTAKALHGLGRRYKVSVAKNSAYYYGGDDAWLSRYAAGIMQYAHDDYFLKKVVKHCDFLGVNYYFSNRVYGYRIHNPDVKLSDLGWDLSPANIEFALERLHDKYHLPIIITENGLADAGDEQRQWWLMQTIAAMQRALSYGVDLQGYLHWSLIDNFEWAYGFWPRFGLAQVDYHTKKRTLRPSAVWFGKVIRRLRS